MPGSPILAGNQVILLWSPVPGAVKYVIYMNGKKIHESIPIQAIVAAPDAAGSYEFQVAAVDPASVEGPKSSPGVIKIFKLIPPKSVSGRLMGKIVGMNWDPVAGAVLYNVYKSTESGKGFSLADSVQDVRWTDSKVQDDKMYYYRITSKDASGKESDPSVEVAVSTKVVPTTATAAKKVIGKRTRVVFTVADKDFTENGIVTIYEPYDIQPSPDRSRFYVSSVHSKTVLIIDSEGKFLGEFGGGDPNKDGNFAAPYGIGVARNGEVYVADPGRATVQVFDAGGKFLRVFATLTKEEWMKKDPRVVDVDIDAAGNVYILEYHHAAVFKFDKDGKELSHFALRFPGKEKTGFANFIKVIGDRIFMPDSGDGRMMVVDKTGNIVKSVGKGGVGVGLISSIAGFDVADDGRVYLVDKANALIQVYDFDKGTYLYTLANQDNKGAAPFTGPVAISVDGKKQRATVAMGIINKVRMVEMFGEPEEATGD